MKNISENPVNDHINVRPFNPNVAPFARTTPLSNNNVITVSDIKEEVENTLKQFEPIQHRLVLNSLLEKVQIVDFKAQVFPEYTKLLVEYQKAKEEAKHTDENVDPEPFKKVTELKKKLAALKLQRKHYLVLAIEEILKLADVNQWGLCKKHDFVYLFNGAYWSLLSEDELKAFLGSAAEKMGIDKFDSRFYSFRDHLYKQFLATAHLPEPEQEENLVLINLKNGTFEVTPKGVRLRGFHQKDFITYQLPFEYDPNAKAPLFMDYLNTVQPEEGLQFILAEYLAYVFTRHLKLEKTLLLYGTGANGKSVFFEVVNALLGKGNVTSYTLQSLTNETGYQRAKLANVLVNYASEINGKLETAIFKQLVSGEPVEARLPYHEPFMLEQYARLIFNCNELPKEVEHTNAFFRRFLIIPFNVTIPEEKQDRELSNKIIKSELSGIFNWVLKGLDRLLEQKKFTQSETVDKQLRDYRLQSDSVQMFLAEEGYQKYQFTTDASAMLMSDFFREYRDFCSYSNFHPVNKNNFKKRLISIGYHIPQRRTNRGYVIHTKKVVQ